MGNSGKHRASSEHDVPASSPRRLTQSGNMTSPVQGRLSLESPRQACMWSVDAASSLSSPAMDCPDSPIQPALKTHRNHESELQSITQSNLQERNSQPVASTRGSREMNRESWSAPKGCKRKRQNSDNHRCSFSSLASGRPRVSGSPEALEDWDTSSTCSIQPLLSVPSQIIEQLPGYCWDGTENILEEEGFLLSLPWSVLASLVSDA